jgi:DNA polymerase V
VLLAVLAEEPLIVKRPLFGSRPAAGFPAPGDDMVEKALDLNEFLVENPTTTFFVRADGDSMEGAHIFSGDILVVDKARTPASGDIVVAAVYGELVVKRWVNRHGRGELVSENPLYQPIIIAEVDDVFIWGVVVACVRRLQ